MTTRDRDRAVAVRSGLDHPWAADLGVIWRVIGVVGTIVTLSLAWILALGMIVPLPAVTAAILRVALATARGRSPSVLPEFLAGIRESWQRATLLGLLVALVSLILAVDLWALAWMPEPMATIMRVALIAITAWWALVNVYLWPLVGGTDMPVRAMIRASVGLSLVELPTAAIAIGTCAAVLLALTALPATLVVAGPGLVAVVWSRTAWRAMRRHLDRESVRSVEADQPANA